LRFGVANINGESGRQHAGKFKSAGKLVSAAGASRADPESTSADSKSESNAHTHANAGCRP
jgi:hypothetical protein